MKAKTGCGLKKEMKASSVERTKTHFVPTSKNKQNKRQGGFNLNLVRKEHGKKVNMADDVTTDHYDRACWGKKGGKGWGNKSQHEHTQPFDNRERGMTCHAEGS